MPLQVWSTCAHHQEVKTALHSLWYHHTYRCDDTGTEYFKHGIYSTVFPLQNAVSFTNLTYLVPVLFTFYIHVVLKFKKIIPGPKY